GVLFSLSLITGPLLAVWGGISAIFWLTAALALIGIYILYRLVPAVQRPPRTVREAGAVPRLFMQTLANRELMRLNFGIFVLHFVLMASFMVLPLILEEQLLIARERMWMVYLPVLAGAFVAMLPFIILAEKKRQIKPVFLFAIFLLAAMEFALFFVPPSLLFTLGALFLFFISFIV